MASDLTKRLLKNVKKNGIGETLQASEFSNIDYYIPTKSVILNLLFSAKWDGGIPAGRISMAAGPKSHGKSQVAYDIANTFQHKFDGTVVLFDSEFASEQSALENLGLDADNIIYFPLSNINDEDKTLSITYQFKQLMNDIERGEKVLLMFDSMGAWNSVRTIANAEKGNTAKDMSIAGDKKGLMSLINAYIGLKGLPCIILNHSYSNVGGFGAASEVSGGGALYYPSSIIEITSKANLKIDDESVGSIMTAKTYKGRLSKEKSIGKFAMHYEHGFLPFFGLEDFALEGGFIEEEKEGRSVVYKITGLENSPTVAKKCYMLPEGYQFWETLFNNTDFGKYLNDVFAYGSNKTCKTFEKEIEEEKTKKKKKKQINNEDILSLNKISEEEPN